MSKRITCQKHMLIYTKIRCWNLATLAELENGSPACGVQIFTGGLLFFGSKNLASVLGVLPSNDRNSVEFSGACGHRTTLESGCENQCSEDAAPLGVAYNAGARRIACRSVGGFL